MRNEKTATPRLLPYLPLAGFVWALATTDGFAAAPEPPSADRLAQELRDAASCFLAQASPGNAHDCATREPTTWDAYFAREHHIQKVKRVRPETSSEYFTFSVELAPGRWLVLEDGSYEFRSIQALNSVDGYFGRVGKWYGDGEMFFLVLRPNPTVYYFLGIPKFGPGKTCVVSVEGPSEYNEGASIRIDAVDPTSKPPKKLTAELSGPPKQMGSSARIAVESVRFLSEMQIEVLYGDPSPAGGRRAASQRAVFDCRSGKVSYSSQ